MEFLFTWLGTCIASFGLEIANELRMFKDVADAGYKIDTKRLGNLNKQLNPKATKISFLSLLIPIFNIIQVFQNTIKYNEIRPTILDQLSLFDVLEEMSDIEKQEYLKKPTGLNAVFVSMKATLNAISETSIVDEVDKDSEKNKNTNFVQCPSVVIQKNELENSKDDLSIMEQPLEEIQDETYAKNELCLTKKRKMK